MTPKDSLQNPWAGLASYEDPAISKRQLLFCGRDAESYDVARLIDNNFVITLYGRSGIGKTSLIQAGVFPLLRREQYTPLVVRFGIRSDVTRSFQDLLTDAIENSLRESSGTVRVINVVDEQTDRQAPDYLWNYFARRQFIHADGGVTFPVAVFDQFEEVFRKPDDRQQAETLLAQLRYLADETHALPDRIVDGQPYSYDFNFRFVLVIREDDLYRLEDSIDNCSLATLKQFRYRLRPLSDECTRSVITIPGAGLFVEAEQEHIVRTIKEIARNKEDDSVSTNILSLICNRIFEAYRKSSSEHITSELVETFVKGNPFEQFYKDATDVCQLTKKEKIYIEENFVDSSGRRDSVSENDFFSAVNTERGKQLLEGNMRIFQRSAVSSSEGNARIELLHDSFCAPLKKMNEQRKKKQKIGQGVAIGTIILLCDIIFFCVVGIYFSYRKLEESQARFIAEKVMSLKEDNPLLAQLLALEVLTDRPDVKEAEVAFREACLKNYITISQDAFYTFSSVSFSPDGSRIVSASDDKTVRIWNAATGECIRTLEGHTDDVNSASFSPDGSRIVSASEDGTVRIWDAATGERIRTLEGHTGDVLSASFSSDGSRIVSASWDKTVRIWDAATGERIRTLEGHTGSVLSASFSPDDSRIVSVSRDETVRVWDTSTGVCLDVLEGHIGPVFSAAFSPDGKQIVSASSEDAIRLWNMKTGEMIDLPECDNYWICYFAKFSSDGSRIITTLNGHTIGVLDAFTGKCLEKLEYPDNYDQINDASFRLDGKKIASASQNKIRIWDLSQENTEPIVYNHYTGCSFVSYSPDGRSLIYSLYDEIEISDAYNNFPLLTLKGHTGWVRSASFSPDGKQIVSASWDETVRIWNAATGECIRILKGHTSYVFSASFSPDGKQIVSASYDGTIRIWNATTGECIRTLEGHTDWCLSASFSPDGSRIVSAFNDGTVRIWDTTTGECIRTLYGHWSSVTYVSFSPDGNCVASAGGNGMIRIWDVATGECIRFLNGHTDYINSVVYSPDGTRIVSAADDNTIHVWDAESGDCIAVLGHEDIVNSAFFSPDGRRIVSASDDKTVRIWENPLPLQTLMDEVRERFKNRPLTEEERRKYYLN